MLLLLFGLSSFAYTPSIHPNKPPHAIQKENENDIQTENEIENEIGKRA